MPHINLLNEILWVRYRRDDHQDTWVEAGKSKTENTYDAQGNLIFWCRSSWNINTNEWRLSRKTEYTYDAQGNLIQSFDYNWTVFTNEWKLRKETEYTIDTNGNRMSTSFYKWSIGSGGMEPLEIKEVWYYSRKPTSINKYTFNDQVISIYPNPSNSILTIETGISDHYNIEITCLNGQMMYKTEMEGTTYQLDLSSFQKGVYFITIRSKDFVTTRKIIKL